MLDDFKPGDMSVRIGFGRVFGNGEPDQGKLQPTIELRDETSGKNLTLKLTAEQFADLLAGSAASVPAANVTGFGGVQQWGRYLKTKQMTAEVKSGDYKLKRDQDARTLPHVDAICQILEAGGYQCDTPRRNNGGKWVVVGRRYETTP